MIKKFNSSGTYVLNTEVELLGGDYCYPEEYIDSSDKICVADSYNNLVKQISFNNSNVGSKVSNLSTEPVSRMDIAKR